MNEASFEARNEILLPSAYNLHATRRTRTRFRLSTSKAPSYAFSFISPSLQAFRARDRIRITLFDKVARPDLTRRLIVPAIVCRADNWPVHASFASFSNGKVDDPRGGR